MSKPQPLTVPVRFEVEPSSFGFELFSEVGAAKSTPTHTNPIHYFHAPSEWEKLSGEERGAWERAAYSFLKSHG